LYALFGYQAVDVDNLLHSASQSWNLAGQAAGPVLDFGRARAQVEAAEAAQKQAYIYYEQTVRVAIREIMDAVEGYKKTNERHEAKQRQETALENELALARQRYDSGYVSELEVLDVEHALLEVQVDLKDMLRAHMQTTVDLYKALGGG
jgi:multidrug efflux system outer membrane protein